MTLSKPYITNNKNLVYLSILIYPLWSLYLSIKHYRAPQAKNLFWLFCAFLGMIQIYLPEGETNFDSSRYAQKLIELNQKPLTWENYASSYYDDDQFVDIYQPTITFLISTVTNNPRWLFFVFAIVFGFFYSRNIWFVFEKFPRVFFFSLTILIIFYILICPIWEINGARMWTAMHVFVYGALPYLYNADKSKLVWCFVSLLIHFSFFLPLTIFLLFIFIPKKTNYLLAFYIFSLLITELNFELIRNILSSFMPSYLTSRVDGYTNESYVQIVIDSKSNLNFYVEGSKRVIKWTVTILLFISSIYGKKILNLNKSLLNMICFSLFINAISNILSIIPSVGRFLILSQMFTFSSIIMFYIYYIQNKFKQKYISMIFLTVPVLLLFPIIVKLRTGCDYYGVSLFFNPIIVFFVEDNQPIIQYVKSMFFI